MRKKQEVNHYLELANYIINGNKENVNQFKLTCSCGNEVIIQNEIGIREDVHTLGNSEIFFQIKENRQVKIMCDKCGNMAFISY